MRSLMSQLAIGSITLLWASAGLAQQPSQSTPVRIGTFDSRAISIAFYNSAQFRGRGARHERELEEARASGDEWRVRRLEAYEPAFRQVMHLQGFGTGSVREIMERIEEELPSIAEEAGVSVIVSKWEVVHKNPAVELVDLTSQLVALFEPRDQVLMWIESLKGQDPIPVDQLLVQPAGEERKLSIADSIRVVIDQRGVEAGIEHYRELRKAAIEHYRQLREAISKEYNFAESELNELGYHYLGEGQTEIAVAIFKLNVEAYPDAYNTFDSLGEAYMEAGQTDLAIQNYERSLELNPGNDNARQMLRRMGVDVEIPRQ